MRAAIHPLFANTDFAVIDLETTGLSSQRDRVVEIAAIKISGNAVSAVFESLIYTEFIPYYATRIHGIDTEMVCDAPSLSCVARQFHTFVQDCVFVGHNIKSFDLPFLVHSFGVRPNMPCVDTLRLSRRFFPGERSHRLAVVAERLGIPYERLHRAKDDALVTARVFMALLHHARQRVGSLDDIMCR